MKLEDFFLVNLLNSIFSFKFGGKRESVYLPEKGHYQRFSTIYEMGFKGTYTGDFVGPNVYNLIPREQYYPIKQMLFCNLLIYVPNVLFYQNLTPEERIRRYGPQGCITAWQASQMNRCDIGLDALNDIVFGLLPKFVTGPCAKFCTKVFVPHLARLASEVVILKPVACSSK